MKRISCTPDDTEMSRAGQAPCELPSIEMRVPGSPKSESRASFWGATFPEDAEGAVADDVVVVVVVAAVGAAVEAMALATVLGLETLAAPVIGPWAFFDGVASLRVAW